MDSGLGSLSPSPLCRELNVRKLYSSLAKLETLVPKGTHEMPLSARKRSGHLSRRAEAKTVTQPYIQMGLCRVRPVTVLGTVGEIEISAQRLDLEGKHSVLLCDYGKSRTLVRYKWLIFTERAVTPVCPNSLCVIYEEHAMVKYPRQGLQRLRTGLSHHFNVPCDSQVLHRHARPCKHTLYAWYKWANQVFVFLHLTFTVVWSHFSRRAGLHFVTKQTLRRKLTLMKKKTARGMQREEQGRRREQDRANLLKGSYFHSSLVQPSITWHPRPLILLRPLTLNLISTEPYR